MKNNAVYLAISNKNEYNIDIVTIIDNKLHISLKWHDNFIILVKYFLNSIKKDNKEYLISSDKDNSIIIWNVPNGFTIISKIAGSKFCGCISGILLCFNIKDSFNALNNYLIFSYNARNFTNLYSLENKQKIKVIKNTNKYNTYYLLFWENEKDSNFI